MNKHSALKDFIQPFIEQNFLYFESIDMYAGYRSIVPNYGDFLIQTDVLGNKKREYTFAFVGVEQLDTGTSNVNELNMEIFDKFNDWIVLQQKNHNYPNFGTNVFDYEWIPLQNMANMAQRNDNLAKYILMVKLEYTEKGD